MSLSSFLSQTNRAGGASGTAGTKTGGTTSEFFANEINFQSHVCISLTFFSQFPDSGAVAYTNWRDHKMPPSTLERAQATN